MEEKPKLPLVHAALSYTELWLPTILRNLRGCLKTAAYNFFTWEMDQTLISIW